MVASVKSIGMDSLDTTAAAAEPRRHSGLLPRVHLASRSPRRQQLLAEHGIEFFVSPPAVDDGVLIRGGVSPAEWAGALAYLKAAAAMRRLGEWPFAPGELMVLGADTVVWKESASEVIGQPRDSADAERILRLLENGDHEVITGVALIDAGTGRRDLFVDRASVQVGAIGDERIQEYVMSGSWAGKAGAYNLRERLDAGWPIEYHGDPGTIMGLPMEKLVPRLRDFADACSRQAMS